MAYNNPSSWDNLRVDDRAFLDLLQSAANQPSDHLHLDPNRFPAPPLDNPTPPASEDSSPSPPSIKEREQYQSKHTRSASQQQSSHHNTRRSVAAAYGNADDDLLKRKVDDLSDSDDSSYEQPQSKHHQKDSVGPRRSSGGGSSKKKGPGGAVSTSTYQSIYLPLIVSPPYRMRTVLKSERNKTGPPSVPSENARNATFERFVLFTPFSVFLHQPHSARSRLPITTVSLTMPPTSSRTNCPSWKLRLAPKIGRMKTSGIS